MQFRPCIDLHDGKVKQIVGSSITNKNNEVIENFVSNHTSSYYANLFKKDQLTGGHVIMLGKGNEDAAIEALQAYPKGLQIGGGITVENAKAFIEAGASHVIVTSYIFHNGQFDEARLKALVNSVGKEHIVLDLSCRNKDGRWFVMTDRWTTWSEFEVNAESIRHLEQYCDEFLIHAVDVEGKKGGMALDLIEDLAKWVKIPTTYAGGVRSMEDLQLFEKMTNSQLHITIGSALSIFGGDLSYDNVVAYCKKGINDEYSI